MSEIVLMGKDDLAKSWECNFSEDRGADTVLLEMEVWIHL